MKTKYFLTMLAICLLLTFKMTAQTPFQRIYGDNASLELGESVLQTSDQGFIIVGQQSFGLTGKSVYLIRTNADGDTLWTKTPGGNGFKLGSCIQQTSDEGYIIVGLTKDSIGGNTDIYLIKTNENGDTLWKRRYGGPLFDYAMSVQQTNDGGYIMAGWTESFGAGETDVYVIKTSGNGDTLWTKTFGGIRWDYGSSVLQTSDGNFIIAGHSNTFSGTTYDIYLIKTDPNGDTLWTKTFGGINDQYSYCIRQTADGGYIIAGQTGFHSTQVFDTYLVKTNADGDTLWTRSYGGINYDDGQSVEQTTDGGYILTGRTTPASGISDVFLIKTNNNGDTVWTKEFGGTGYDRGFDVKQTSDGGYVIAGETASYGSGSGDLYLIKTDQYGFAYPLGINNLTSGKILHVYPNPFKDFTTLKIEDNRSGKIKLTIFNAYGQVVREIENITGGEIRIERSNLTNGVYFFSLSDEKEIVGSGEMIVKDI